MKITYSAPLPVNFSGEEGMLYGKPGLGIASDLRVTVSVEDRKAKKNNSGSKEPLHVLDIVDEVVRASYTSERIPYELTVHSDIPEHYIGYAQALLVALTACLAELYSGNPLGYETVNKLAYTADKKMDRQSHGLLVSTAVFGGLVYFRKEFEFLKTVYKLPYNIPSSFRELLQADVESSKDFLHKKVTELYRSEPEKTEQVLSMLEKITKRIVVAIMKEDKNFFEEQLIERNKLMKTFIDKTTTSYYSFTFSPEGLRKE